MTLTSFCSHMVAFLAAVMFTGCAPLDPKCGTAAVQLNGIDGHVYEPLHVAPRRAAVLIFIWQDCPICNGYAPQIRRMVDEFTRRQVRFYLIHVDPGLTKDQARAHATQYGYIVPVLLDRRHELVRRLNVRAVPTTVVLDAAGIIRYQGRIDDRYVALGKSRQAANTSDLRDAITAVLDRRPVPVASTRVVGCAVPDEPPS